MSSYETSAPPFELGGDLKVSAYRGIAPLVRHRQPVDDVQRDILQLFDEFAPALRRYVRSCGLSPDVAEDVVQDAFLALFRHLQRDGDRRNLRGWLVQVGYRGALKHRQRLARRQRREGVWAVESMERAAEDSGDPEVHAVASQRRHRLRAVVRTLPPREQSCLQLRAEGLSYREIAHALNVSLGTVAKSLARAVKHLIAAEGD